MRRLLVVPALAALALLPATAQAKPRAHVYRGVFVAVGADGAYTNGKFGKVQLVDGKRNDKLSVHLRKLGARTAYVFRLQAAAQGQPACQEGAPGGADVPGWRYRRNGLVKSSRKGVANSWARSKTFSAQQDVAYYVAVYTATPAGAPDQLVLCAKLKGNRSSKKGHGKGGGHTAKPKKHGQADSPKRQDTPGRKNGRGHS